MPLRIFPINFPLKSRIFKIILVACLSSLIFCVSYGRLFDAYENILLDLRFHLRGLKSVSEKIVIVEVSDDTLKQLGYWPLPRDFHASLIDVLSYFGAKQIMFDFIFTDPSAQDGIFSESIQKAGNVYLPYVFRTESENQSSKPLKAAGVIAPIVSRLAQVTRGQGHINSYKDVDGKTRWVPLFIRFNGVSEPHIALRMACDYLKIPLQDITMLRGAVTINKELTIPVSPGGALLVNYAGRWKETFRHYSYVDLLASWSEKLEGKTPRINLEALRGKICLVGLTATGTPDLQAIPFENNYPMVGLHANIINSILLNRYVYRASQEANLLILFLLLAFVFVITAQRKNRPVAAFLSTFGYSVVFFLFGCALFIFRGIWVDLFCPIVLMLFMNTGMGIYNFLQETRHRELMEKELSIAKTIQESFLPVGLEEFQSLEIAAHMVTAKHVGGDLYDMCLLGKYNLGIFIGDVSGKGVPGALVMAKTISLFRMLVAGTDEPSDLLFQLNEEMSRNTNPGTFVTATYLVYAAGQRKVMIASAGHMATLVMRKGSGDIEKIQPKEGLPLGLMGRVEFSQEEIVLEEGDKIVLFTDGIVEAKNLKREEFGENRLFTTLRAAGNKSAKDILRAIERNVQGFVGKAPAHDDNTLIVLKERGAV